MHRQSKHDVLVVIVTTAPGVNERWGAVGNVHHLPLVALIEHPFVAVDGQIDTGGVQPDLTLAEHLYREALGVECGSGGRRDRPVVVVLGPGAVVVDGPGVVVVVTTVVVVCPGRTVEVVPTVVVGATLVVASGGGASAMAVVIAGSSSGLRRDHAACNARGACRRHHHTRADSAANARARPGSRNRSDDAHGREPRRQSRLGRGRNTDDDTRGLAPRR